jgi:hypothetical protein
MRSTASGGRVPLISRRSSSRAVAISTICDRKDTDSRARWRCAGRAAGPVRCGCRPPAPPGMGSAGRSSVRIRSSFRGPARHRSPRCSRVASTGPAAWAGARRRTRAPRPTDQGWCSSSGRARRRSPGSASCSRCARAASRCRVRRCIGSSITCGQEPSSRAICRSARCSAGPPRRCRRGGGWYGGSGLPRPPGWPRRAPRSCGGTANRMPLC